MGIPWDEMGRDRHKLLWDGMGQKSMSHGQACLLLRASKIKKDALCIFSAFKTTHRPMRVAEHRRMVPCPPPPFGPVMRC